MPRNSTFGDKPHDVTMPQLGMAQDAGKIVAWLKSPGEAVAKGDALFEVETDKATMEVEAQADGFLTGIAAHAGDDVPVGAVIAQISASAEDEGKAPQTAPQHTAPQQTDQAESIARSGGSGDLPDGTSVTMPQLGMAQDTGLLVNWLVSLGEPVAADDVLFEVETDKSTMDVPAGVDGYLAATLADAGQQVPVGAQVAVISAAKPDHPVSRSHAATAETAKAPATKTPAPQKGTGPTVPTPKKPGQSPAPSGGRILASPKLRRLALEQGLDLARLVKAGHPQPFHVSDLATLQALPADRATAPAATTTATCRLTAETAGDGFAGFAQWAATAHALTDADALLAGLAGSSLTAPCVVAIERFGQARLYAVPAGRQLSGVTATDAPPDLILRDLRATALRSVSMGATQTPVLTLMQGAAGLSITLESAPAQLEAQAAITLLSNFADRMEQPLHHLL